jgi:hypothetical protein
MLLFVIRLLSFLAEFRFDPRKSAAVYGLRFARFLHHQARMKSAIQMQSTTDFSCASTRRLHCHRTNDPKTKDNGEADVVARNAASDSIYMDRQLWK